ncbi:hypothetical protein BDY19DRAFT_947034 [Irpex rosettiformis]|uniref:Uncharacterized protein n=1 Tax=Irpex rosettiformis TaxID=378272 RepID=A0ACB8U497_9APHY|nr:hypothetical protein BDY19DRAFT_947034 [Irpex rosettiformis]
MSGDGDQAVDQKPLSNPDSSTNALGLQETPQDVPPSSSPLQQPQPMEDEPMRETPMNDVEDQDNRQLDVTDALGYLDCVKAQFLDQSDVYNRFLDIMKDFKSQFIDTPGVIDRVSALFRGHPSLIQGFNTFLPAGYRIDCVWDDGGDYITVTTPSGTKKQAISELQPADVGAEVDVPLRGQRRVAEEPSRDQLDDALSYIHKVKSRYADTQPTKYQKFLKILNPPPNAGLTEKDVLQEVSKLFEDDEEIVAGFQQFLIDRHAQHGMAELGDAYKTSDSKGGTRKKGEAGTAGATPTSRNGATSSIPQKRKRKTAADREREEREKQKELAPKAGPSKPAKRTKQHHTSSEVPSPALSHLQAAPQSPRRQPGHQHGITPLSSSHHTLPQRHEDLQFFDRVKRVLDNRETYNEFLKVVNLFTQDIIDTARLIRESHTFLGDGVLMAQFKDILGWDERRERYAGAEDVWTRPTGVLDRPSRNQLNMRYGSYRKLPDAEMNVLCSGRDEMCKSVLNDEWVSQPTFASEDSGFLAHKKNSYEEALHRSEEERHEYDFHIEAIHRTIQMLEPFNNKINQLNHEEKASYKFKPNLAQAAKSIHLRVIKKVYGKEAGMEVFQAMQEVPIVAIPLVLTRLKQKHEEWKRAQREWNKVWKEVDARNYYKSLDHQGITFKATDKKTIAPKTFINQIEAARDEQMAKRAALIEPLFARTRPRHQLEYIIDDTNVLQDALKLVCSFLDRTQLPFIDRKKIETFVRTFVPLLFMLDSTAFNAAFVPRHENDQENGEVDPSIDDPEFAQLNGSRGSRATKKAGSTSGGDLRKRLLKSEQAKSSRRTRAQDLGSPSSSRPTSPRAESAVLPETMQVDNHSDASAATAIDVSSELSNLTEQNPLRKGIFFTNTHFYVLFRQLELLYSRLHLFKTVAARVANEPRLVPKPNTPLAETLGLLADVSKLGDRMKDAGYFYEMLLTSCEKLFDNELEQHVFEDQMRYMFGIEHSYKIFTVDKLIGAIIKQIQTLLSDIRSQKLFDLLRAEREMSLPTTQDLINFRKNTERIVGPDENLFRMVWLPESKTVTIQLLGKDDSSFDDSDALTSRWQAYVDSYVSPSETGGLSTLPRMPFLRRNVRGHVENDDTLHSGGSLALRVCVRTYKLFYVSNTEEVMWRSTTQQDFDQAARNLKVHNSRKKKWLLNFPGRTYSESQTESRTLKPEATELTRS